MQSMLRITLLLALFCLLLSCASDDKSDKFDFQLETVKIDVEDALPTPDPSPTPPTIIPNSEMSHSSDIPVIPEEPSTIIGGAEVVAEGSITQADVQKLEAAMGVSPSIAYIDQAVQFENKTPVNLQAAWTWDWQFNGTTSSEPTHTFRKLGKTQITLRATGGGFTPTHQHTVLVTVSKEEMDRLLKEAIKGALAADAAGTDAAYDEMDKKFDELKSYMVANAAFDLPNNQQIQFEKFTDILIADFPIKQTFSSVSELNYDSSSGKITRLVLR